MPQFDYVRYDFKDVGNVVVLNSGGPNMVVKERWEDHIICSWRVSPSGVHGRSFEATDIFLITAVKPAGK